MKIQTQAQLKKIQNKIDNLFENKKAKQNNTLAVVSIVMSGVALAGVATALCVKKCSRKGCSRNMPKPLEVAREAIVDTVEEVSDKAEEVKKEVAKGASKTKKAVAKTAKKVEKKIS